MPPLTVARAFYLGVIMKDIILEDIIQMPLLALRGIVVFPGMSAHFEVGRKKSINAINKAATENTQICLVTQKDIRKDDPTLDDLYDTCIIANIKQQLRVSGDSVRVLVEGVSRAKISDFRSGKLSLHASVRPIMSVKCEQTNSSEALIRKARDIFLEYSSVEPNVSNDVLMNILVIDDCGKLADYMASNIKLPTEEKQSILDELDPLKRLKLLIKILHHEISIISLENKLHKQVAESMDRNQRDYYLREELKAIYAELGDEDDPSREADEYISKIKALGFEEKIEKQLIKEASKLPKMQAISPEATVTRNYLDTVISLPWNKFSKDKLSLEAVRRSLDKDHYGLDKVKERIIEYIAVHKLCTKYRGQIICLVGPPGVGKTSIAKSIAKAMGKSFARVSLGGVHDEAEIRGHRKTYIGSMPGRIIDAFRQAGTSNPLILLDEIDKMSSDFKSDPTAAMLEVLDSEQNCNFRDNYLEIPFDISNAMFITTANTLDTVPAPLLDRMEIIELGSYTQTQKFHIAKKHLIKKQVALNGLKMTDIKICDDAIVDTIEYYTRESGVRQLERLIGKICRKAAAAKLSDDKKTVVTSDNLKNFLGEKKFIGDGVDAMPLIGVSNGLAWTSVGGEVLKIEVLSLEGTGKVQMTGSLGDVMKESVDAAISYIRANYEAYGIDKEFYKNRDIHIHFPEGATPKDGPSAGITIATAIISELSGMPVRNDLAMTGELRLKGDVLPIGGLNEKLSAAARLGYKQVIVPAKNSGDLEEVDKEILSLLKISFVSHMDEVSAIALIPKESNFNGEVVKNNLTVNLNDKHHTATIRQ